MMSGRFYVTFFDQFWVTSPNLNSRALFLLNGRVAKRGFMENEGRKSDASGAGDTKSEEEKKTFLSATVKFSKKREKN